MGGVIHMSYEISGNRAKMVNYQGLKIKVGSLLFNIIYYVAKHLE